MPPSTSFAVDTIDLALLNEGLVGTRFGRRVEHVSSIGSTSTELLRRAADGADEGAVLLADEQTAGRGRGAHVWHSAAGSGLYFSALVRPALRLHEALLLSLATGLAVQAAVRQTYGVALDLRWPNDLMVERRKLGGILVETSAESGADARLHYAVVGIGINVHHTAFPPELRELATSLTLAGGRALRRDALALAILRALDLELTRLEDGTADLRRRFAENSTWALGREVFVPEQGGYTGRTSGLDARGFLRVRTPEGDERTVLSGGVRDPE